MIRSGPGRLVVGRLWFLFGVCALGLLVTAGLSAAAQTQKKNAAKPNLANGQATYLRYCASCYGKTGKGDGPAAMAMKTSPADLTTLAKRHEGKYPRGYVSAVLNFGKSFASHGSEDMPIWGARFRKIDLVRDPLGQQHVADVVAYLESIQAR